MKGSKNKEPREHKIGLSLRDIKKLIQLGESASLEFKSSTSQLGKACETLCGFLNHQGGVVLLGVKDRGDIVGQMLSDKTRQEISQELKKFEPPIQPIVEYVSCNNNKYVIAMKVGIGEHKPYIFDGRPYERVESTTRRMPQARYDQLVAKRAQLNYSWESFNAEKYKISDLDEDLILGIVRKAVGIKRLPELAIRQDVPSILERLRLLTDGCLNNAAVVLFAKELFPVYPQCQLKVARFKGNDRREFLDSHITYGNVFQLLEEAMQFVRKHLPVAAKIVEGQLERVETPLIPFKAIREAMINALCHKDYAVYGGSIGLAIYDERMEIFNDGGLLPGVTLEKIKSGFSMLRNPLIAEVLYKGDLIEKWGRGVHDIISNCMNAGDPEPELLVDDFEFKIVFKFPQSLSPIIKLSEVKSNVLFSKRQQTIIQILGKNHNLKASEIMHLLEEKTTERTLRKDLTALKKQGIVHSSGHARTSVWSLVQK